MLALLALPAVGLLLLAGCAPGATSLLTPPSFELLADGSGLTRVDPPGIGTGSAVVTLRLLTTNPNPVGLRLASLDGALYLAGQRAADASFAGGVDLPANGSSVLTLDLAVPLASAPQVLTTLAGMVAGTPTELRLDASLGIDAFGVAQRFPTVTLVRTTVTSPLALVAPRLRFDGGASEIRLVGLSRVEVTVGATLENRAPIGYRASVPEMALFLGGSRAASLALQPVAVPAGGTVPLALRFTVDPSRIGAALAGQLGAAAAGAGSVSFSLRGAWTLDAGAFGRAELGGTELLGDALR